MKKIVILLVVVLYTIPTFAQDEPKDKEKLFYQRTL